MLDRPGFAHGNFVGLDFIMNSWLSDRFKA
jgi:hypothetical protein